MPILDWVEKDKALKAADGAPYRLIEEVPELSFGDADNENMLIQGDNLDALKALIPYYAGRVKCIYIDPPYNTGSAFEDYYDDNIEHSTWLSLIYPRLELLHELLSEGGSIWMSIDDNECHYLKVICDEIFGRNNFVASVIWEKRKTRENRRVMSFKHDHILVYAKKKPIFDSSRNLLPLNEAVLARYKNPDADPRGKWQSISALAQAGHATKSQFYELIAPNGKIHSAPDGNCWRYTKERMSAAITEGRIWFGKSGNNVPRIKKYLSESDDAGLTPETIWYADEAGTTDTAKKHSLQLFRNEVFDTPKPEELINRVFHIATNPGDLVLDSFLGSGTTTAVAHKMDRKYIGIELGDHAVTHCAPRLQKVIDGEQGGISSACKWDGGGGFRFFRLGEGVFDETGQINPDIRFPVLAAHIWFSETHTPWTGKGNSPLLGVHNGVAYYLLYNGILGDRKPQNGNVLTSRILAELPPHDGAKVVYGEWTPFKADRLRKENIVFKQTPYDVKAR
ncbi:MAG: site-specific DNA-methyltransferase [Pontiella sp.]